MTTQSTTGTSTDPGGWWSGFTALTPAKQAELVHKLETLLKRIEIAEEKR